MFTHVPTRGKPGLHANSEGVIAPPTGLIVKFDGTAWRDGWHSTGVTRFNCRFPDCDVFVINATAADPIVSKKIARWHYSCTTWPSIPVSGNRSVCEQSEREDNNRRHVPKAPGHSSTTVRGSITQSRISIIDNDEEDGARSEQHLTHSGARKAAVPLRKSQKPVTTDADGTDRRWLNPLSPPWAQQNRHIQDPGPEQDSFQPDALSQITLPAKAAPPA